MTPIREIPGPVGPLEVLLDEPADGRGVNRDGLVESGRARSRAAVVFAHPHPQYGGTMHTKAVYQSAKALARIGCAVLRFNFRGVGRSAGTFDQGEGERDDFRAAVDFVATRYPDVPIWAAGMSFGAWIALAAGVADARVSALIGLSAPIGQYDFEAIAGSEKPKFLIHGERDELFPLREVRLFYGRAAEPKELIVIDSADHLFDGKMIDLTEAIEELFSDWPQG